MHSTGPGSSEEDDAHEGVSVEEDAAGTSLCRAPVGCSLAGGAAEAGGCDTHTKGEKAIRSQRNYISNPKSSAIFSLLKNDFLVKMGNMEPLPYRAVSSPTAPPHSEQPVLQPPSLRSDEEQRRAGGAELRLC